MTASTWPDGSINISCEDMLVKPGNKYGATKCFGEASVSNIANVEGLSSIVQFGTCIFAKGCDDFPLDKSDAFLAPDNFYGVLIRCIKTPDRVLAIAHNFE